MIAGHFGFAALVKGRERSTPLWLLMFASVWLDIVFVPLFLAGVERISPVHGRTGYGNAVIYADYTHSFAGMLVLSALLALICFPIQGRRVAVVAGLVAASHWLLDVIVHHADMTVLPGDIGNLPRLGLGLWRNPALTAALEAGLVLLGAIMYWGTASSVSGESGRRPRLAVSVSNSDCSLWNIHSGPGCFKPMIRRLNRGRHTAMQQLISVYS